MNFESVRKGLGLLKVFHLVKDHGMEWTKSSRSNMRSESQSLTHLIFSLSDVTLDLFHLFCSSCCRHVPPFVQHFKAKQYKKQDGHPSSDVGRDKLNENHSKDSAEDSHQGECRNCTGEYSQARVFLKRVGSKLPIVRNFIGIRYSPWT
jgi:hypothetical protein